MKGIPEQQLQNVAETKTDIVIVGYGPVGAALAVYLGKLGISVVVIEKNLDILQMPRAIALDNEALRVLQQIGLSEDSFEKIIINKVRMHSPFLGKFAEINTSGKIDMLPKLVTFYQPDLEKALRKQLLGYKNVSVLLGAEFVSFEERTDGIDILIRDKDGNRQTIQAKYLVGADGASSKIRTAIGMDFKGESYSEDWLIVDAKNRQGKSIDHVEFICDPKRPSPHMPAPGGRERWEFMLKGKETREEMEQPEKIQELLKPWIDGQDLEIERQAVYRFHARCCDHFQLGKVFLVGDAAHITPPFVGQGLVAGLRDAANLGWKLAWVIRGRASSNILKSYDLERRPHAKKMIQLAKGMGMLVMPSNTLLAIAVHGLMKSVRLIPTARTLFEELKIKPANSFQQGLFLRGSTKHKLSCGGQLPQGQVTVHNNLVSLSDHVLGDHFTIIGVDFDPLSILDQRTQEQWQKIGGQFLTFTRSALSLQNRSTNTAMLTDDFISHIPLGWIVIIRPDRVIMHSGPSHQAINIVNQCINLLKE